MALSHRMYHPFLCLCDQLHCIFSSRPTFFPSFCLADVPVETFRVALHIPHQIQFQAGSLTPSLQVRDSSCVTRPCFNLLYASFLCLSLVRSSLLFHAGPLPPLLCILLIGMDCSWVQRSWSLKTNQLSWTSLLSRTVCHGIPESRFLSRRKSALF